MSDAETLAEMILRAAGSGMRHYTPQSKAEIIKAAEAAINAIRKGGDDV
ncbi:MAG: hypothetical protein ACLGIP_16715 [Alphaproteobacteria bacterium]